jgi:hypothetical protein
VSKAIRFSEVHKSLTKAIRSHIRDELSRLPDKILDRVCKLVLAGATPTSGSGIGSDLLKSHHGTDDIDVSIDFSNPSSAGEKLQDFMEAVYDDLLVHFRADTSHLFLDNGGLKRKGSGTVPRPRGSISIPGDGEEAKKERKERLRRDKDDLAEKEASEGTERVEALVCRLLYNRYAWLPSEMLWELI